VVGRAVSIADLSRLCGIAVGPDYDDAVEAAVASGLVVCTGPELAFVHDLVRQSIYESMAADERRQLHSRYAQHFLASGADPAGRAAHAKLAVTVGDESNARVMVVAAEALVTTSAADAAHRALHAVEMRATAKSTW